MLLAYMVILRLGYNNHTKFINNYQAIKYRKNNIFRANVTDNVITKKYFYKILKNEDYSRNLLIKTKAIKFSLNSFTSVEI
ncbi:hypothetical protein AHMF7605_15775 [Adhaeribacter arboris]|uniref:Uncharacterized protein n=1 Tax=Adhaeribacter arboris TaxID=2072846 RepID=A0A2T2YH63_9BACT|nr:hypothetical protein AHMF7605_15775 [Adhaeribacter arboris]